MQKLLLTLLLLVVLVPARGQTSQLSRQAQISIITCGPYQGEVYSAFGHTAIRVYDPVYNYDAAYNYGVFDFDQPNFYLNFARGNSLYKLGVMPYPWFRDVYISYNRYVHEQVLNLTAEQKQKVFDFLEWNALPENCNYLYDYFYDNCATRARDVFVNVLKEDVIFDSTFIKTNYSIRNLTDIYLGKQPWGDLGIDICLGLPMDKKASPYEYMFLPDYIEYSFQHASIRNESEVVPLVVETIPVYESKPEAMPFSWFHPWIVFGALLAAVISVSFFNWKKKQLSRWLDGFLFGATGIIGILLLFLWFGTNHKAAAFNFNLLWALPTHVIGAYLILRKKDGWSQRYFTWIAILMSVVIGFWAVWPQQLNPFLLPVAFSMLIRALLISQILRMKLGSPTSE